RGREELEGGVDEPGASAVRPVRGDPAGRLAPQGRGDRAAFVPERLLRSGQRGAVQEGLLMEATEITPERPVLALGGGPAGLTAGYLLAKQGKSVIVLESTDQVGGIARTEVRDGYRFDLGGHRFFTKSREVDDLWHEVLGDEFLRRPRRSRIYWNHKFL